MSEKQNKFAIYFFFRMQRNLSKVTANYVKYKIIIWLFHNKCVNLHRISKLLWQIY